MIHGIQMTEQSMDTKIAVLEAKVEHMMVHTKELTLRVRANEKVVASVSLLGVIACTFIGAGYFAPKADAHMLNNTLTEYENGSNDPTKSEELLQLPSNGD